MMDSNRLSIKLYKNYMGVQKMVEHIFFSFKLND